MCVAIPPRKAGISSGRELTLAELKARFKGIHRVAIPPRKAGISRKNRSG